MPEDQMQTKDWIILVNVMATAIGGMLAAWYAYRQKQKQEAREEIRLANEQERLKWEAERAKAEDAHRHRMEELQLATLRQGGAAARAAKKAEEVAKTAKEEIKSSVEESKKERREQMESIAALVEDNTKLTREAIDVSNGYNAKILKAHESVAQVAQLIEGQEKIVANTDTTATNTQKLVDIAKNEPPAST